MKKYLVLAMVAATTIFAVRPMEIHEDDETFVCDISLTDDVLMQWDSGCVVRDGHIEFTNLNMDLKSICGGPLFQHSHNYGCLKDVVAAVRIHSLADTPDLPHRANKMTIGDLLKVMKLANQCAVKYWIIEQGSLAGCIWIDTSDEQCPRLFVIWDQAGQKLQNKCISKVCHTAVSYCFEVLWCSKLKTFVSEDDNLYSDILLDCGFTKEEIEEGPLLEIFSKNNEMSEIISSNNNQIDEPKKLFCAPIFGCEECRDYGVRCNACCKNMKKQELFFERKSNKKKESGSNGSFFIITRDLFKK